MKQYFTIFFLMLSTISFGQISISGNVVNVKTNEAIAGANVFISNTSYKTVTNAQGEFYFEKLNIQKGELIVNALGYKHEVINIDTKTEKNITISLEPVAKDLDAVLVRNLEKDGYQKWGKLFVDGFIGTTHEAFDCRIENTKALKFYYNKKTQALSVGAIEPLKIINKALGYQIDYTLESFEYNAKSRILFFSGYPVFTEIQKGERKMRKWQEKRDDCYRGSIMHFMRALYRNKIAEEGFIVQKANKILNEKKAAYKKELRKQIPEQTQINGVVTFSGRGENNENVMSEPDSVYQIVSQILPSDSFAFAIDSITAGMYFEKYLIISFRKQNATTVSSFVKLLSDEALSIYQNGYYYRSINFFTERYWAETEKMSRMLPFDFVYKEKLDE